ncbi:hypothetical protein [Phascolarctobacterium succinatutens]|uniref:hypothetical protein n=1 Tax=Phascolarctobacterium succinatutens TaxID=626940 RepID=UPI00307F5DBC
MSKNLISEIAKMLGVEIGEEFKVNEYAEMTFKFTENMLVARADFKGAKWGITYVVLSELLGGNVEIIKLPWKPKKGDVYFTFELLGGKWVVRSFWWGGFPNEYALLDKGWVYRTCEEAQAALPKVAAEIGVDYEL